MPDINALFIRLYDDKGAIWIASELEHKDTARVKRWYKERSVPDAFKFIVLELLQNEGTQ